TQRPSAPGKPAALAATVASRKCARLRPQAQGKGPPRRFQKLVRALSDLAGGTMSLRQRLGSTLGMAPRRRLRDSRPPQTPGGTEGAMAEASDLVTLKRGGCEVQLSPATGGSITRFRQGGFDLVRPADEAALAARNPRGTGGFPMFPFAGRIAD